MTPKFDAAAYSAAEIAYRIASDAFYANQTNETRAARMTAALLLSSVARKNVGMPRSSRAGRTQTAIRRANEGRGRRW